MANQRKASKVGFAVYLEPKEVDRLLVPGLNNTESLKYRGYQIALMEKQITPAELKKMVEDGRVEENVFAKLRENGVVK